MKVASLGLLAVGRRSSALLFGSMMLIDSPLPELQIGLRLILPITFGMAGIIAVPRAGWASRRSSSRPVTGKAGMLDEAGQALTPIDPGGVGRVATHGEIWSATADEADRTPGDRGPA